MARIPPLDRETAPKGSLPTWDHQIERFARMTNMKRTLAHSPQALRILMEWYTLKDTVQPFLGERLTILYSHAVSSETDCLICSTFFRRIMIDWGENPDALNLTPEEQSVVDFGQALARDQHRVSDAVYAPIAKRYTEEQIVALTAFGAMMVATNIINNVLQVELDEYLYEFRKTD